jgi:hypothetical protein
MALSGRILHVATAAALAATLALGGCGGVDGIDLNGKVFDWMGISSSALENGKKEPQLAARTPLVLPPDATKLPEPGTEQSPAALAELNDPDLKKASAAKERERLHLAYCRGEVQWKDNIYKKTDDTTPRSPYGPCPGLFGGITGGINKQ